MIREGLLDGTDQAAQHLICVEGILASLQNDRAEPEFMAFLRAGKDHLGIQTVALRVFIAAADPAVETVISADTADLDQTTGKDLVSVDTSAHTVRLLCKRRSAFRVSVINQIGIFLLCEGMLIGKPPDQLLHPRLDRRRLNRIRDWLNRAGRVIRSLERFIHTAVNPSISLPLIILLFSGRGNKPK